MQGFLVSIIVAILERLLTKGTSAYLKFLELQNELQQNQERADKYQKVVDSPANREERKRAEDSIGL